MPHFNGFCNDDFDTLDGCSWRGRDALGGVLSHALRPQLGTGCQSWGVRRRVELHVAKKSEYNSAQPRPYAKLFVYTHDELAYGFYVEARGKREEDSKYVHWQKFRDRMQSKSPLRDAVEAALAKHDVLITDYYRRRDLDAPIGRFASSNGAMKSSPRGSTKWRPSSLKEFTDIVAELSGDEWINIHIYAGMDRDTAIKMGKDVVAPILTVLDSLAPVYMETIA